jgi:ferrous iron transport protein A
MKLKSILKYIEKVVSVVPLTMARAGERNVIKRVSGKDETRRFLENLGFVSGAHVIVVSEMGGNMIVNVKDSRVAINRDMAGKIMI